MPIDVPLPLPLTRTLADFAVWESAAFPQPVLAESTRAFINWLGCVLGGCREEAALLSGQALACSRAVPAAMVIGQDRLSDPESAAFVNCISSSALAYDDTHLATVTHPTGPVASALFALAQTRPISGRALAEALAVGIEIQCRLSNALLLPPAKPNLALYITGVTGAIGTAAAVGRVLELDAAQMTSALGLAAAQSCGFRATHGSMAGSIVPSFAVRSGMLAARLAMAGVTCSADALEGPKGFLEVFAAGADGGIALDGLGSDFELFQNAYKPYPCGIVVHPIIDACLKAINSGIEIDKIRSITLKVHPLAKTLADRIEPGSFFDAQVSLQHWAAITLVRGRAGVAECRIEALSDPAAIELRRRMILEARPEFNRNEAALAVELNDGSKAEFHIDHARGSIENPLTVAELSQKFVSQATPIVGPERAEGLLSACLDLLELTDTGATLGTLL